MGAIFQLLIVLECLNVLSRNKPQQNQVHLYVAQADTPQKPAKELACPCLVLKQVYTQKEKNA